MNAESSPSSRSVYNRALWLLRTRPVQFWGAFRGFILFWITSRLFKLLSISGVHLAKNVRIQRLRCVSAEAPDARVTIGEHTIIYEDSRLEAYGRGEILIGRHAIIGQARIVSRYRIEIGERFLSSWNVFIQDFDPHPVSASERALQVTHMTSSFKPSFNTATKSISKEELSNGWPLSSSPFPGAPIHIGNDVWVGANVTILKGADIGDGCIVASGAVVLAGSYPPRSLLAGNPATVVKELPI
jgi:acetyltransferase-like isoleucine patch superfamily enzyme